MNIRPFAPIERAVRDLIQRDFTPLPEGIGRDLPGDFVGTYVRIERTGGSADRIQGDFLLDIEVFHTSYSRAESTLSALGALLLGYPHTVEVDGRRVTFDRVVENVGPQEIPWEDDNVYRLHAMYVITARR